MVDVIAPRTSTTQQTVYERFLIKYNSNNIGNYIHFGTIPLRSFIVDVHVMVEVAFNAGTTNTLTIGTTYTNANEIVGAGDVTAGTIGMYNPQRGVGTALTQAASPPELQPNGTYADTCEGGVGLYAKFAQTGTPATAGQAVVVIEYITESNT